MNPFSREEIESAQHIVYETLPPTPQFAWPLLAQRLGSEVWVKHENHSPVGAFKLRGGLVYMHGLAQREPACRGVVSATRGNHGQSIAFAARRHGLNWRPLHACGVVPPRGIRPLRAAERGLSATIVVPHGNSAEKNAAMRALGAELIEHGEDFQQSREHAAVLAGERGLHLVPSLHRDLVRGVATYWIEFFRAVQPAVVFVPVGMGSGIWACAAARAFTGARSRIVGVVSAHATAYLDSFKAGRVIEAPVSTLLADGMACRVPDPEALALMQREVDELVAVSDDEVGEAMRVLFRDTHNVAEGAGAAALAAAMQGIERWRGQVIGVTLSGGNVDRDVFARVLAG